MYTIAILQPKESTSKMAILQLFKEIRHTIYLPSRLKKWPSKYSTELYRQTTKFLNPTYDLTPIINAVVE